ncbi:MAG: HAD family phosphatase [Alphaproteobacteria bacterium]|nr:MAG: HAD family phosphatase [Alphaproteobacteria bacterium]
MSEIEAVVFDIGNVLVEWHPERPFDRALGEAGRRRLFAEVDLEGMNRAVDLGAPFAESVEALAARHPEQADIIRLWRECWMEMFAPVIEGSVALKRALRAAGVPVYALSNFGSETFEMAEAAYPFLKEFDRRFISGRLGVMKPDAAIYEMLERETGHAASRLLFIDDRPENIAAAEARGWRGHLFDGPERLAERLAAEGFSGMEAVR